MDKLRRYPHSGNQHQQQPLTLACFLMNTSVRGMDEWVGLLDCWRGLKERRSHQHCQAPRMLLWLQTFFFSHPNATSVAASQPTYYALLSWHFSRHSMLDFGKKDSERERVSFNSVLRDIVDCGEVRCSEILALLLPLCHCSATWKWIRLCKNQAGPQSGLLHTLCL